jgi:hypothetical protein
MGRLRLLAISCAVSIVTTFAGGRVCAADDLAKVLLAVVQAQADSMNRGAFEDYLGTIHSQSPAYLQEKTLSKNLFGHFKVRAEVSSFKLIGVDGEYAFARCVQKTTKVSGPAFHDNVRDVLEVFRKEGDKWKSWLSAALSTRFLDGVEGRP